MGRLAKVSTVHTDRHQNMQNWAKALLLKKEKGPRYRGLVRMRATMPSPRRGNMTRARLRTVLQRSLCFNGSPLLVVAVMDKRRAQCRPRRPPR